MKKIFTIILAFMALALHVTAQESDGRPKSKPVILSTHPLIENNGTSSFHINWGWGYNKSSGWASEKYYIANSGLDFGKNMQHLYLGGAASK